MIEVNGLCKQLPNGKTLLDDINFSVKPGEFVGILGGSGAGKSLTLRCVMGLVNPTKGDIVFEKKGRDGSCESMSVQSLGKKGLRELRREMGVIFQGGNLVKRLTALENVMIGRLGQISPLRSWLYGFTDKEAEEAYKVLQSMKMEEYAGRRVGNLSGGEQQRVAIARAIFQKPSVYLADEPVSSLDPKNARKVMKLLKPLSKDKPVIGVFHQPHLTAEFCSRVIAIKSGKVVYDGDPDLPASTLAMIYEGELEDVARGEAVAETAGVSSNGEVGISQSFGTQGAAS
ncbi:MAG: phosphonate ABC transporter ATP-binding protein [Verrucomicrobiota bacterium]